jgi:hypothetical protein
MKRLLFVLALCLSTVAMVAAVSPKAQTFGTGSISGIVTDEATNLPIAGAIVTAGGCGRRATTAEDGSYTIANLPTGDYTVKAMKCDAYVTETYPTPVHVEDGQAVTGIDFALTPLGGGGGTGTISGHVYDQVTGLPLEGARVSAGGCGRYALTVADGSYTIPNLTDGSYTVKAMKSGYTCATYPTPVVISGGAPVTGIDFQLVPMNRALD